MSDPIREQLSALMDGELPAGEQDLLLRRLDADPALRAWWQRQHRAREVLRNEASPYMEVDLAGRVMAALDDDSGFVAETVKPNGASWWRPVAGLAVAASVATVAIIGVQQFQSQGDAPMLVAERLPTSGTPLWASRENSGITRVVAAADEGRLRDPRLDAYLASHAEQAMMLGSGGWLPYSRLVGQVEETPDGLALDANR
ncbi:MAG: sigma-E factor negative regulatory protein [Chromatiales bacterium]|nr:sigma-E factor negative regulatory protein [Gammaproteobacteria bacterium]MCP5351569.1 sigma-E factor negative regulatory protein [Chromatiales bacterium]